MTSHHSKFKSGLYEGARFVASPNFDARSAKSEPEVIIIHSISLPPGDYEQDYVERFFCNQLNPTEHPYFRKICHLRVSSHFFIRRDGELVQFVNTDHRAWHAGVSECLGKNCVNDFSIGIELEGWDEAIDGFADVQYHVLANLCSDLMKYYDIANENIYGHSDIAPGRKNDPGSYFDWQVLKQMIKLS